VNVDVQAGIGLQLVEGFRHGRHRLIRAGVGDAEGRHDHDRVFVHPLDQFVSEYVESEFLTQISSSERAFLTRTAVLERMSGPLCEAVLETGGSAAVLAGLARSNLLLVPLDRRGQWYRYHHLFRDMLQAELERVEPGLPPVLRRRAAVWCVRNDLPEEALEYSMAVEGR
jgi:LuxR family transcriptional regulator, maltose regulon positive regulatory protein